MLYKSRKSRRTKKIKWELNKIGSKKSENQKCNK